MMESDKCCWSCHLYIKSNDKEKCAYCPRNFHKKCSSVIDEKCLPCADLEEAENATKTKGITAAVLNYQINFFIDYIEKCSKYPEHVRSFTAAARRKNDMSRYRSRHEFLMDFKIAQHIRRSDEDMCRKAYTEIEKYFDRTFKALAICGNCPDCYDLGRSMIAVCRQPHILLWVSFAGFNYWPAKFMDVDENSGRLNVVFFGDYTAATVPSKSVYLFSWQFPDKGIPPTSSLYKTFLVAWNEIRTHISLIRHEFGTFNAAEYRQPFKSKDIQKHFTDMFGECERQEQPIEGIGKNTPSDSIPVVKDDDKFPYVAHMQEKLYDLNVLSQTHEDYENVIQAMKERHFNELEQMKRKLAVLEEQLTGSRNNN